MLKEKTQKNDSKADDGRLQKNFKVHNGYMLLRLSEVDRDNWHISIKMIKVKWFVGKGQIPSIYVKLGAEVYLCDPSAPKGRWKAD